MTKINQGRAIARYSGLTFALMAATMPLGGCEYLQERLGRAVAAPALDVDAIDHGNTATYCNTLGINTNSEARDCVAAMLNDSQNKCVAFMNKVFGNKVAWDSVLGITSLAASTASSSVGPAVVAKGFGAAATVLTGSRSQLDADIYANAGPGDFYSAMSSTYNADMLSYYNTLSAMTKTGSANFSSNTELLKIHEIHSKCSLDAAEATIKATLASASNKPASGNAAPADVADNTGKKACTVATPGSAIAPPC